MKTYTNGNIIVDEISEGDIHYEMQSGRKIKCKVLTTPSKDERGLWYWKSIDLESGGIIEYMVKTGKSQYSPYLFDNENCED